MKFSIALLFTLFICVLALAAESESPIDRVLKSQLNVSLDELKKQCESKSKYLNEEFTVSRAEGMLFGNALANVVVRRVKHLSKVEEKNWDEIINEVCISHEASKLLNDINVHRINMCLDDKKMMNGEKKSQFRKELLKEFCGAVKKLAKYKRAEKKNRR